MGLPIGHPGATRRRDVNGYPEQEGDYDWSELEHRGSPPPLKIKIGPRGKVVLMDGNHRLAFWRERGMDYVPAWVVDERPAVLARIAHDAPDTYFAPTPPALARAEQARDFVQAQAAASPSKPRPA